MANTLTARRRRRRTGVRNELWSTRNGLRVRVVVRDPQGRITASFPHPHDRGVRLG
jgi:hypothetical protein